MAINKVGIVGTGTMGLGIAQVCAQSGYPVVAVKATPGSTDKAKRSVETGLGKMVERGKMEAAVRDSILANISFATEEAALADCDRRPNRIVVPVHQDADIGFFAREPKFVPQTLGGLRDFSRANRSRSGLPVPIEQRVFARLETGAPVVPGPDASAAKTGGEVREKQLSHRAGVDGEPRGG